MSSELPARRPARPRRILFLLSFVAVCAIVLAAFGIFDRARGKQEVKAWTDEQAISTVRLVQAEPGPLEQPLLLPGNVSAFNSALPPSTRSNPTSEIMKAVRCRNSSAPSMPTHACASPQTNSAIPHQAGCHSSSINCSTVSL